MSHRRLILFRPDGHNAGRATPGALVDMAALKDGAAVRLRSLQTRHSSPEGLDRKQARREGRAATWHEARMHDR